MTKDTRTHDIRYRRLDPDLLFAMNSHQNRRFCPEPFVVAEADVRTKASRSITRATTPRNASRSAQMVHDQRPASVLDELTTEEPRSPIKGISRLFQANSSSPHALAIYREKNSIHRKAQRTRPSSPRRHMQSAPSPREVVYRILNEKTSDDEARVMKWLKEFENEAQSYPSISLYCEIMFQQSSVLTGGQVSPNRLRTAVALHCLQKLIKVFGRYDTILNKIFKELIASIYVDPKSFVSSAEAVSALDFVAQGTTFFHNQCTLEQKIEGLTAEIQEKKQNASSSATHESEERRRGKQSFIASAKAISFGKAIQKLKMPETPIKEDEDKAPPSIESADTERVRLLFQSLQKKRGQKGQGLAAPRLNESVDLQVLKMDRREKLALLDIMMNDPICQIVLEKDKQDFSAAASARVRSANEKVERAEDELSHLRSNLRDIVSGIHFSALDISGEDEALLEKIGETFTENAFPENKNQDSFDMKQVQADENAALSLASKFKTRGAASRRMRRVGVTCGTAIGSGRRARRNSLARLAQEEQQKAEAIRTEEKSVQADEKDIHKCTGYEKDRKIELLGVDLRENRSNLNMGIESIIQQSKLTPAQVKKLLRSRKLHSLSELNNIILTLYQAKMQQDIQDDNSLKLRELLPIFIRDVYTLQYGLKALAINHLVLLDASIKKLAKDNARVRIFGLLVGSLEPGSCACSHQAVDFYLFAVAIIFNVGHYVHDRKSATLTARKIKDMMGDGIPGSPGCFTLSTERIVQVVRVIFAFSDSLEQLIVEVKTWKVPYGELDVDTILERFMVKWISLHHEELRSIRRLFEQVDVNQDGILDFEEFSRVASKFDENMSKREMLALYDKVAGDDNVINVDEFIQAILTHQREAILNNYLAGKKKDRYSFVPPSTSTTADTESASPKRRLSINVKDLIEKTKTKEEMVTARKTVSDLPILAACRLSFLAQRSRTTVISRNAEHVNRSPSFTLTDKKLDLVALLNPEAQEEAAKQSDEDSNSNRSRLGSSLMGMIKESNDPTQLIEEKVEAEDRNDEAEEVDSD